jgi:hypothetical protein
VNARSLGNRTIVSPAAGAASSGEQCVLNAEPFRRIIALERKRSERSRKPFVLLLLDMGERLASEKNGKTLEKILSVLSQCSRETDFTGWYADDSVIGVVFTEIAIEDSGSIPNTLIARVTAKLRRDLPPDQFNQLSISFHVFPEDWKQDDDTRPSNPTLYPDLSHRDNTRRSLRVLPLYFSLPFF